MAIDVEQCVFRHTDPVYSTLGIQSNRHCRTVTLSDQKPFKFNTRYFHSPETLNVHNINKNTKLQVQNKPSVKKTFHKLQYFRNLKAMMLMQRISSTHINRFKLFCSALLLKSY